MHRAAAVAAIVSICTAALAAPALVVSVPPQARQFELVELRLELPVLNALPATQVHDAFDADRNGVFIRLTAEFTGPGKQTIIIPGFAMKDEPDAAWQWCIRWSPRAVGEWHVRLQLKGRAATDGETVEIEQELKDAITVAPSPGISGPLVKPGPKDSPHYLRRLKPDGTTEAAWLFGACRAWVVTNSGDEKYWNAHEWLDRETELLAPMRDAGYNLLNQWMAPWEYFLVHHDRAEQWRKDDTSWQRIELPPDAAWSPYQCYDQGRAFDFDQLVKQCEGGPGVPTVHLLLSPMPHQCLQVREHSWGAQESGWSPANDAGRQSFEKLNGFSGLDPNVWNFFNADPSKPLDDRWSQYFDHQANFFRYIIARWSYSRAIGLWVLIDELDAVGDRLGYLSRKTGWWGHPQCERWLADVTRMFRGELVRSDGYRYPGDPYQHPLHSATTSYGGGAYRGENIDWDGGPVGAQPDMFGWHWYPWWWSGSTWSKVWTKDIDGVALYSDIPIGRHARLVSEFGAVDRYDPDDPASPAFPSLYHFAIWTAVFDGHAGTPMDWDDGKEFGELRWRPREGAFDREHYPIDNTARLKALRKFLADLDPGELLPCRTKEARIQCKPFGGVRVFALHRDRRPDAVFGWLFTTDDEAYFTITGLQPGDYTITWFDPWTGEPVAGVEPQQPHFDKDGLCHVNGTDALAAIRQAAQPFPDASRLDRGHDIAFKLLPKPKAE